MNVSHTTMKCRRRLTRRIAPGLLLAATLLALPGCARLFGNTGPVPFVVQSDMILLAWDAGRFSLPGEPSAVSHYNVYYRTYGTMNWELLQETPDSRTMTTIGSWQLDFGSYEFAVEEVYVDESASSLHTSTDLAAWPPSGWYIVWESP